MMSANAQHGDHGHLPDARDLLDKHVASTGGERAHLALKSRKKTGKLAVKMSGHDFVASIEDQALAPNKTHSSIDGDFFFQVSVCDGEQAWEWRPGHSHGDEDVNLDAGQTEFVTGGRKARAIEKANFYAAVNWRDRLVDVKTIGLVEVDGAPAFEVQVTTKSEETYSQFYDKSSGRLVKRVRNTPSMLGNIDMEVYFRDYQEFDGLWVAMTVHAVLKTADGEDGSQTWTWSKVEHNKKVSLSLFELPEELSASEPMKAPHRTH